MEHELDRYLLREERQAEAEDHGFKNWAEYMQGLEDDKADADYEATRMEELGL